MNNNFSCDEDNVMHNFCNPPFNIIIPMFAHNCKQQSHGFKISDRTNPIFVPKEWS